MVGSGEAFFNLQSMGFAEATRLKRERYPTVSDKLASDKVQKISSLLVSFLSLLISFAALIVAAFALVKAK